MTTTVESHTHSAQYSSDGSSWNDFSSYVESFATQHGYTADRGTVDISCYEYPSGLAENDYVVLYIDGETVFNGRMARPALHYFGNSVVIQCEGRGAYLAKNWKGDGVDPELNVLFERVYENQTARAIIVNLCEAAMVETNMQSIEGDNELRGTVLPVILRPGETFWSLIRGENGLDEIRGSWTAETKNGAITRRLIEYAASPHVTATEGDNIISADRTPQGTESIINRCIVYGLETEIVTFGGIGIGDYSLPNTNIEGYNPRVIRTNFVESDAEALAMATAYVLRHNFPYDEDNIVLLGDPSIDIGQTVRIDSAELDHDGTSASDRFIAEVSHRYGVGVGYETSIKAIRVEI